MSRMRHKWQEKSSFRDFEGEMLEQAPHSCRAIDFAAAQHSRVSLTAVLKCAH